MPTILAKRHALRFLASAITIAAITLFYARGMPAHHTTISLTFLLAVLGIAADWGLAEAVLASILATASLDYFFLPPVGSLHVVDSQSWLALIAFLITAITASHLSVSARRRAAEAEARKKEVERLYALGQAIMMSGNPRSVAGEIVRQFVKVFEVQAAVYFSTAESEVFRSDPRALSTSDEDLRAVAREQKERFDKERKVCIIPIQSGGRSIGSLGIVGGPPSLTALNAVANLVAVAIERAGAIEEAGRIEAIRQSEALKSALIDALAHDIKTPLTSIKGSLTHLMSREQNPEAREFLMLANEEADRLHRLVAEMLEMAQIEAGGLNPQVHPEAIGEIVCAAAADLDDAVKTRDIKIRIPRNLPLVNVDFNIMRKAIKQILDNSCRYSPPDSTIEVLGETNSEFLVVSVCDHGTGIEIDEQPRIFDKFFRGKKSRDLIPGSGLGLSIAKRIVEAHGGRIWVESKPGAGSTFHIGLPFRKVCQA